MSNGAGRPAGAHQRNGMRRWLVVSLAAHVSFFAAVTVLAHPRFTVPKRMDTIPISLAAGLPAPPPGQMHRAEPPAVRPTFPAPKPQPRKTVAKPPPKPPDQEKRPVLQQQEQAQRKRTARKEQPQPQFPKRGSADTTQVVSSDLPAVGDLRGTMQLQVEGQILPYSYYVQVVQQKIARYWEPPPELSASGAAVIVWFRIEKDGSVNTSYVEEPSGSIEFDTSALRALERAEPLPPLPEEYPGDYLVFHLRFVYTQ
jgi:protein TonB